MALSTLFTEESINGEDKDEMQGSNDNQQKKKLKAEDYKPDEPQDVIHHVLEIDSIKIIDNKTQLKEGKDNYYYVELTYDKGGTDKNEEVFKSVKMKKLEVEGEGEHSYMAAVNYYIKPSSGQGKFECLVNRFVKGIGSSKIASAEFPYFYGKERTSIVAPLTPATQFEVIKDGSNLTILVLPEAWTRQYAESPIKHLPEDGKLPPYFNIFVDNFPGFVEDQDNNSASY